MNGFAVCDEGGNVKVSVESVDVSELQTRLRLLSEVLWILGKPAVNPASDEEGKVLQERLEAVALGRNLGQCLEEIAAGGGR